MDYLYPSSSTALKGSQYVNLYKKHWEIRSKKYPIKEQINHCANEIIQNGITKIDEVVDINVLNDISKEMDNVFENDGGHRYAQAKEHFQTVGRPFLECPSTLKLAFQDIMIDIATQYFQCMPAISHYNLRRSYVHNKSGATTQIFHCDPNSPKFLKFFFYLNDVDMNGGPFVYIKGSHRNKFNNWNQKARWDDSDIEKKYGKSNFMYMTAKAGDMIIADTSGFHKGLKPTKTQRDMLTIDYSIHHVKFDSKTIRVEIPQEYYDELDNDKKPLCDFAAIV